MKKTDYRRLGLTVAVCGAFLLVAALAALLWPRSASTVVSDMEAAAECMILRDRAGAAHETTYLTPEQLADLRAALTETTLSWSGRRPDALRFWEDKPLYRVIFDRDLDGFEMVGSHVYSDGWGYRLPEKDAARLSALLDSFFAR